MTNPRRPLVNLEPDDTSLADGTSAVQPGQAPSTEMAIPGEPVGHENKVGLEQRLVKRIKVLREDIRSRNDYTKLKIKIYEEGGKWRAPNGVIFGMTKEGWVYEHLSESKAGVARTMIVALDADPPFIVEIHTDLQFVKPENREAMLKELEKMAKRRRVPPPRKPEKTAVATPQSAAPEIIVILDKDWLSKISLARWGTIEWHRHLKPTEITLAARAKQGKKFNEDLIYPGDTFEVIS